VGGIPQALLGTIKSRVVPPVIAGPPNGPVAFRVSAMRQGVTGTKCVAVETMVWPAVAVNETLLTAVNLTAPSVDGIAATCGKTKVVPVMGPIGPARV